MGAWVTYGLGTENDNLPGFITICPTLAHGGVNNWGSAFLPAYCQGVPLGVASKPSSEAQIKYIQSQKWSRDSQRMQLKVNGAPNLIDIPLPHTVGLWGETDPVEVSLEKGSNVLTFSHKSDGQPKGFSIKDFTLTLVR